MVDKKGIFFGFDALIALALILAAIVLIGTYYIQVDSSPAPVTVASDLAEVLSNVRLYEINDSAVVGLLEAANVTNYNVTILEQTLRFQVEGNENEASQLLDLFLEGVAPTGYEVGLWIEDFTDPIYISNDTNSSQLISSKQLVSGIEKDQAIEGVAARALLSNINTLTSSSYVYFGGYEGDGNVTKIILLPDSYETIDAAEVEINGEGSFELFINNNSAGNYTLTPGLTADNFSLASSYLSFFQPANNTLEFIFNESTQFIGGGFVRVDYTTSDILYFADSGVSRAYFPGIQGLINIYSSFFVPGIIQNMSIALHYLSDYEVFLNIGNRTVFSQNATTEQTLTIGDDQLRLLFNYSELSNKTIPLRLGLRNVSYTQQGVGNADVFLVTDVSGSMGDCGTYAQPYMCDYDCGILWWYEHKSCEVNDPDDCVGNVCGGGCGWPGSYNHEVGCDQSKLEVAQDAADDFIDGVLNASGNQVGLVSYQTTVDSTHDLSNNTSDLKAEVAGYTDGGGTCICCGINQAASMLDAQSDGSRPKAIVVMSDGEATTDCNMDPVPDHDQDGDTTDDPDDHTIEAACLAFNESNATVHTVAFGEDLDANAQHVLNLSAQCGNGEYYFSDVEDLAEIYQGIADSIINFSFSSQSFVISDGVANTTLFSDSFIEFTYIPSTPAQEFGRIPVTVTSNRFGNNGSNGSVNIQDNTLVYDARVLSYSGDKWTDNASVNQNSVFDLTDYSDEYVNVGDPFVVNIPVNLMQTGNNIVHVSTGGSATNKTGGSQDNRIIYTGGMDIDVNFTSIFTNAEGCNWFIVFEDQTNTTISVPQNYVGSQQCTYTAGINCEDFNDDAIDATVCQLLKQLDLDDNGELFVKFGQGDLEVETSFINKVPYLWGPTIVEVRVWR